jgi:hypothetical protein
MDLRQYYKKLHEMEAKTPEANVLVVSVETGDGGKEGVITEAPRINACQLILEGRARRANEQEAADYRLMEGLKREEFQRERAASKVEVRLMPVDARNPAPAKSEE